MNVSEQNFFDRFTNLSDTVFTKKEKQLIEKGFNHNIKSKYISDTFDNVGVVLKLKNLNFIFFTRIDKRKSVKVIQEHYTRKRPN